MSMDKHGKLEAGTSSCDCGNPSTRLTKSAHGEYVAVCDNCYSNIDARAGSEDTSEDNFENSDE